MIFRPGSERISFEQVDRPVVVNAYGEMWCMLNIQAYPAEQLEPLVRRFGDAVRLWEEDVTDLSISVDEASIVAEALKRRITIDIDNMVITRDEVHSLAAAWQAIKDWADDKAVEQASTTAA